MQYPIPSPVAQVRRKRYLVHVDSADRDEARDLSPGGGDYRARLPQTYKDVVGVRLVSAEIPSSFYTFSNSDASNTTLRVRKGAGSLVSVSIPDGNYTVGTMATALKTALDAAFSPDVFTVTISVTTMCLSISHNSASAYTLDCSDNALSRTITWGLGYFLGFNKTSYTIGVASTLTAPNVVRLNPYTSMFLELEGLNGIDELAIGGGIGAVKTAFAKIPLNADSFEYTYLSNQDINYNQVMVTPPMNTLDRLRIRWRFHDGRVVNFRGSNFGLTLEIDCVESGFTGTSGIETVRDRM